MTKLGQLGEFKNGLSISKDAFGSGYPFINLNDIFGRTELTESTIDLVEVDNKTLRQFLVKNGDILFVRSSVKREGVGLACLISNPAPNTVYSGFIIRFRPNQNYIYPKYASYYLNSPQIRKQVLRLASSSANTNINQPSLESIKVVFPTITEQIETADRINSIDQKINLLTKKKEALETYKKGLMQKIFSQELRFKREDGTDYPEWKEVLYSEFLKERDSKHPQSDEFPLCSFVAYKGVVPKGERYNREFLVSDKKGKKYKRTVKGDFIYSSNNLETGSIGLNTYGDGCISTVYSIFSIDKSCDINFITNYLVTKANLHKMIRFRQGVMYGQWRIHETDFLKIKVALPSNEEQKHIGEALQSLNSGIKELERLISATSKFKKGLLQQMFV